MKKILQVTMVFFSLFLLGCAKETEEEATVTPEVQETPTLETSQEPMEEKNIQLFFEETPVEVKWEDNASVEELKEVLENGDCVVQLHMYGGFEQVGDLGFTLTSDDEQIKTEPGDIVLYASNQISIFYGSNSWAYTRLGKITNMDQGSLEDFLAEGDISITLSLGE